jgi:small subunit ribosomal protein S20
MANIKSSAKRARQAKVRTTRNRSTLNALKTTAKKTGAAIGAKEPKVARELAQRLSSELDRAVKHGTIHRNAAARRKSRLARQLAALK